jgi:hypothetical protein
MIDSCKVVDYVSGRNVRVEKTDELLIQNGDNGLGAVGECSVEYLDLVIGKSVVEKSECGHLTPKRLAWRRQFCGHTGVCTPANLGEDAVGVWIG